MDPASIIGLTVAIVEGLWKVGNGTADFISKYREFDNDARALENKIRDENNRTRALRMLLLEPSSTYRGKSLFEQFDIDVQKQILILLEEASDVLLQAHQLLHRRQGLSKEPELKSIPSSHSLLSTSGNSSFSSLTLVPGGRKSPISLQRIRWSLSDKKRVEGIVDNFSDLNLRIHENIKLWCLGTSIGVDLHHLQHLESDPYSQTLGFDVDARLQIATSKDRQQQPAADLEMNEKGLREALNSLQQVGDSYGIVRQGGDAFLLEFHSYNSEAPVSVQLDDRTKDLVNRLANLLHQPKEVLFRIPSCAGWFRQNIGNKVAYVFNIPDGFRPEPISLLDVLSSKEPPPSLGQRFWLALRLSRCISQLQLVKWVHESFRSENVLFLPRSDDETHDLSEPWVFGFEFSRPEMYFSHGHADTCLARDVYRHPARQGNPTQMFSKIHDIYALGVVLLEIGLWQPALTLDKTGFARANPESIKSHLIKHTEKRLESKMGTKYKEVVVKCLSGNFGVTDDNKDDLKLQQVFRSDIVDVLERAASCI